jgi:hypothetical protein
MTDPRKESMPETQPTPEEIAALQRATGAAAISDSLDAARAGQRQLIDRIFGPAAGTPEENEGNNDDA